MTTGSLNAAVNAEWLNEADAAPRRANLARYTLWQIRDFLFERVFVIGVITMIPVFFMKKSEVLGTIPAAVMSWFQFAVFFAVWASVSRIVSTDRGEGTFRYLFAKPVNMVQFYGQQWLLHGALCTGCILLIVMAARALGMMEIPILLVLLMSAVVYVGLGGFGLLMSVLVRRDGMTTLFVTAAIAVLHGPLNQHPVIGKIFYLLPPVWKFTSLSVAADFSAPFQTYAWGDALWVVGYGLGCAAIALFLLARRPMAVS